MEKNLVFVDAETDGLYGGFLTVAMIATDRDGQDLERTYLGIRKENMKITSSWVEENVLPRLGEYEVCEDEKELLERTWEFWLRYADTSYAVCDVGYPVEARLFRKCVELNPEANTFLAPFPLLDISSLLLAKGYDPLMSRAEFLGEQADSRQHNALYDAEVSVRVWKKLRIKE